MGTLELTTKDLANVAASQIGEEISNIKGISNGISFDVEMKVGIVKTNVPLKVVFEKFDFDEQLIYLDIQLNSDNSMLKKGFDLILKNFSSYFQDELPYGAEINGSNLIINTSQIVEDIGLDVSIMDVEIKSSKTKVYFEINH